MTSTFRASALALLALAAAASAQDASPALFAPEPWDAAIQRARYEVERGRTDDARDILEEVLDTYDHPKARDQAITGIAATYMTEKRYERAILYLNDSFAEENGAGTRARLLYRGLERRITRARDRSRLAVRIAENEYEDISWFNIFKLFEKLDRRKDLKNAEQDRDELQYLHGLFESEYLFPGPMPEPIYTIAKADETQPAASDSATEDDPPAASDEPADDSTEDEAAEDEPAAPAEAAVTEADAEDGATEDEPEDEAAEETSEDDAAPAASGESALDKEGARAVLADEIEALLALIPKDHLALADRILDGSDYDPEAIDLDPYEEPTAEDEDEEATEAAEAPSAPADASTTASADASDDTTGEAEIATAAVGTLETVGGAGSEEASASVQPAAGTGAAVGASPWHLRQFYLSAYQDLQSALMTGDAERIRAAREEYFAALEGYRASQRELISGSAGGETPKAPETSTSTATEGGDGSPAAASDSQTGATSGEGAGEAAATAPAASTDAGSSDGAAASTDAAGTAPPATGNAFRSHVAGPNGGLTYGGNRLGTMRTLSDGDLATQREGLR